ncbi:hypothetical protein, conserved [Plasmodium gonderi]|uniref:ABC1 atypical kinase-like domain-containing protein n=1 Tax=Plasmodium gonderi TaxID=77519 RepID=A0A1Y1JKW5_PLAGO|nr:hypothetical protein, conserved [Plasmodium gonderi]GAW83071.1 hypothetical protein, conserved [Plasmodium gonderi]
MNQYDQWNRRIRTIWYCSSLYVEYKNALRKAKKMPVEKKTEYWEKKHEEFATKMLNNIYELRGWWVKVGQFLSTQENIMPMPYIEKFTKLQDMMPTSSFDKIEIILKRELGNIYDIFEHIENEPLASASIGQVHRAQLKNHEHNRTSVNEIKKTNDYDVIIKIQHEGIDQFLSSDINTLKKVSWAFGLIDKNFYFTDFIDEWQDSASRELNYKYELYHQILAYNTFKKSGIPLKIPKIYCAYTTSKVLVMEYIKGFKITDTNSIKKYNINAYDLVYKIIDYFAYQIHNDGFFHGDPHPGNILVMVEEKKRHRRRIRKRRSDGSSLHRRKQSEHQDEEKDTGVAERDKEEENNEKLILSTHLADDNPSDFEEKKKKSFIGTMNGSDSSNTSYTSNAFNTFSTSNRCNKLNAPNKSNISSASMEDLIDARYNIDKMKCEPTSNMNPFFKSFSFVDYSNKKNEEISDQVLKEDYNFIINENMSDGVSTIRKSISKSEEYISYSNPRRDHFQLGTNSMGQGECQTKLIENENNSLHMQRNMFQECMNAKRESSKERNVKEEKKNTEINKKDIHESDEKKKNRRRSYTFVPAIIDWGLIKQLDGVMKLAFCKLVYNISCMNVLNIIEAFEDMGFCFKEDFTYDPEIYIENLKRFFLKKLEESSNKMGEEGAATTTAAGTGGSKEQTNGPLDVKKNSNLEVLKNIDKKDVVDKNPISDVPKDIIFFMRVASLLHGLCTQMNVSINYLSIFSRRAREALEKMYKPIHHSIYTIPIDKTPNSFLEKRIHNLLKRLYEEKKILGCQVAIIHNKKIVVDTCVGVTSTTDRRPITRHSLFSGYSLNKAILTIALIHLMSNLVHEQHSFENFFLNFKKKKKKKKKTDQEENANNNDNCPRILIQKEESQDQQNKQFEAANEVPLGIIDVSQYVQNKCKDEISNGINKFENDYFDELKKTDTHLDEFCSANEGIVDGSHASALEVGIEELKVKIEEGFIPVGTTSRSKYNNIYGFNNNTSRYCENYDHSFSSDGDQGRSKEEDDNEKDSTNSYQSLSRISSEMNSHNYFVSRSKKNTRTNRQKKGVDCQMYDTRYDREKEEICEKIIKDIEAKQIRNFKSTINDYICNYWDGFICNNKKNIRIKDVLTLKCFIKKPFHEKITLSKFIDTDEMIKMIENSRNYNVSNKSKMYGEYLYLIDTYIISELINNISGLKYYEYIYKYIIKPLNLKDEMYIPIPSYILKKHQNEMKKSKNNNDPSMKTNEKGKKNNNKEKKSSLIKESSNILRSNELIPNAFVSKNKKLNNISNFANDMYQGKKNVNMNPSNRIYNNREIQSSVPINKHGNVKFSFIDEITSIKRRSISVDVYYSSIGKNNPCENSGKWLKSVNNMQKNKLGKNELNGVEESEIKILEDETNLKAEECNNNAQVNILLNNKKIADIDIQGKKCVSNNVLDSYTKNKEPFSFRNKLLNHVDNLRVKTKKINDSIKNMYENNENIFLKNFFMMQQKKNEDINNKFVYNYRNDDFNYMYDKNLCSYTNRKMYENYLHSNNNYYCNEFLREDMNNNKMDKKWNIKNINKITSNLGFSEKNKKNMLFVHTNDHTTNKRSRSCMNYKLTNYSENNNMNNEKGNKLYSSNNSNCVVFKYQNDTDELLSNYSAPFIFINALNNSPEYNNTENDTNYQHNHSYNLEEGNRFYKLNFDENIKTLFHNVNARSSGDESANSVLKEKYNQYHRRNRKYRKLFNYIKDLRRSIQEKNKKIRNINNPLFNKMQNEDDGTVGSNNMKKKGISTKNLNTFETVSQDLLKKLIKNDEELLKKLIDYKYNIMQKQRNNILKRKNKMNIYTNEYSEEIEMFSDSHFCNEDAKKKKKKKKGKARGEAKGIGKEKNGTCSSPNNSAHEMEERRFMEEKKHRLETYLVMNKLYKKNNKDLISEENHTINKKTDVYWRLAYANRDINFTETVSKESMNNKFGSMLKSNTKGKKTGGYDSQVGEATNVLDESKGDATRVANGENGENATKGINEANGAGTTSLVNKCNLETKLKTYLENFNAKQCSEYISLFQLAQAKPYVVDPLIYDSKKILDKFIPINGRYTARAMCKILAFANNKFFFPPYIMNKVRKTYSLDESVESLILTGGMSRKWGMGFQLFECEYADNINEDFYLHKIKTKGRGKTREHDKAKEQGKTKEHGKTKKDKKNNSKIKRIVGYGQSDFSGCLAVSFPEIDLSLTILLTDIFKGATVSHIILEYVLKLYGIKPKWKLPVKVSELMKVL